MWPVCRASAILQLPLARVNFNQMPKPIPIQPIPLDPRDALRRAMMVKPEPKAKPSKPASAKKRLARN
jgi:hypothetical protein